MRKQLTRLACSGLLALSIYGCSDGRDGKITFLPDDNSVFAVANGCFAISPDGGKSFISTLDHLAEESGLGEGVSDPEEPSRFLLRPSDLGKYLLYDQRNIYLTSDGQQLLSKGWLASDINSVNGEVVVTDRLQSEGEWQLLAAANRQFLLKHIKTGTYIGADGSMVAEANAAKPVIRREIRLRDLS